MQESVSMKMSGCHQSGIQEVAADLQNQLSAELFFENWRGQADFSVLLLVFEKWYFRTTSYVSLTIMLSEDADGQTADVVCSGGGMSITKFRWGANHDLALQAIEILKNHGFKKQ